jgi:signal transduction histidine kinase
MQAIPELSSNSPIFRFFEKTGVEYLAYNLVYGVPDAVELEKQARELLNFFKAEFCLPFMAEEEPFGLLMLGPKADDEPYTATDITLMVALVRNLSLIINQLRLKSQVLHAQELELLGRMSRGMAHDLNNLVTPIRTLLQLMNEGVSAEDLRDELLPVALRSIETMREYVREALFFSENARPDFRLGRLDVLLAEAVDITAPRRAPKNINIAIETPGEVLIEMDKSLVQRMVTNVIANAVDASPPFSTIRVELVRLLKTEAQRDWLRIRIIDQGEGIKPEDMSRIFTPYFTTKDRGDQTRGFGLGLSICRKVVQLHNGYLNVFSELKKGTTVQIDLPDRQTKPAVTTTPVPAETTQTQRAA